jgi:hypothetical protein
MKGGWRSMNLEMRDWNRCAKYNSQNLAEPAQASAEFHAPRWGGGVQRNNFQQQRASRLVNRSRQEKNHETQSQGK